MSHQFQCRDCPQTSNAVTEFIDHVKNHAVKKDKATKELKIQNGQNLGAFNLQRNIDVRLENEEIQSYICGQDQESVYDNRIRKGNWCEICDMTFTYKWRLKEHTKTVHKKVKNLNCNLCEKSFGYRNNLERHLKSHENIKSHKCFSCNKSFSQKSHLKRDMARKFMKTSKVLNVNFVTKLLARSLTWNHML